MKPTACELCNGEASLYCESDSAFLCWDCDATVHQANFLVARHLRRAVCTVCRGLDNDHLVSGVGFRPTRPICRSCESGGSDDDTTSSSSITSSLKSSSTCISCQGWAAQSEISPGRTSARHRRRTRTAAGELDARAEAVLVGWCRRVGVADSGFAVGVASHALGLGMRKLTSLPFRVCAAAAVWFAARACNGDGDVDGVGRRSGAAAAVLERLEKCSGVPAKVIVAAENRISRIVRRRHVDDEEVQEEGWGECS